MIDPVIRTFHIFGFEFALRWYGVIVMLGVIVGSLMVERVLKNNGENSDTIWDALIWVLPIGILGARLWFVMNATLGGPASAAAMAASKGWDKLVLPGILVGIWGYIIGTAIGIAMTNGLIAWPGAAK